MSTYAIGDIQGCLKPLQCLLKEIAFDPNKDQLWLAGDLINRGPDTLGTLRFLYGIRDALVIVLGNHDLHFLAVAYAQRNKNEKDTLDELLQAPDCPVFIQWLRQQKLLHHDPLLGFTMVHAGIPPHWNLQQALACAHEVEAALQGPHIVEYLSSMYGNKPNAWTNNLTGSERLRLITNYFTRMRFCNAAGDLELETKENAAAAPVGYAPWFSFVKRKTNREKIIFGHWAALEGRVSAPNVYALDTGCVWGGRLTALRLDDMQFFSCACDA